MLEILLLILAGAIVKDHLTRMKGIADDLRTKVPA